MNSIHVRFNNVLIDVKKIVWVAVSNNVLLFRFENKDNDITFNYADANSAILDLNRFETLVNSLRFTGIYTDTRKS